MTTAPTAAPDTDITGALACLHTQLLLAWAADTSADPHAWTPERPSLGQCAVTALVVQDRFGGTLLRCTADGESHYFNRLEDGTTVDLTRDQFPVTARFTTPEERDRSYVTGFAPTARRYQLLAGRIG